MNLEAARSTTRMSLVTLIAATLISTSSMTAVAAHASETPAVTSAQALQRLLDGNGRYVADHPRNGRRHAKRRAELATTQHPIAVIVSCSDSRVPPELVFDEDLGDVFVVRTAGHVVDDVALGSIEYAVAHLDTPLVLVLGHERCGAVAAAVAGGEHHDHVASLVEAIAPAVTETAGKPGDGPDNAMIANVRRVVEQLRRAGPVLAESVETGRLEIAGGRYDLDTGLVPIVAPPAHAPAPAGTR